MNTTFFLDCIPGNLFHTKETPAIPEQYYLGLSKSAPNVDGSGVTEPDSSNTGYQRVLLSNLSEPTNGLIVNNADINFPESETDWGTITHYVIFDSPTAGEGNLLMYGELIRPRNIEAETVMSVRAGHLKLHAKNPE